MITAVGVLLWLLMGLAFACCLRLGAFRWPQSWVSRFGVALLAAGLALLLFRPDEEVAAGEDAGAYFNAALSFARTQSLFAPDPALAVLPVEARGTFRYGHAGFEHTKDAVLWAQDASYDRVGPHFFPAYSVLLSVPAALGAPYLMFPLSALLPVAIALLLALLARWLTGRALAGWIAFALFLLNPAVIWNARCLRAEWPASFLALSGIVLWLAHNLMPKRVSPAQAFLGGLTLAAAGWFHVTAFYVMIPTVLASLWLTRRSVCWTAWWCGLVLGCGVFLAQVIWITDPYWLKNNWSDTARRNPLMLAGILGLAGMVGMRWCFNHFNLSRAAARMDAGRFTGGLVSLGCLLIILFSLHYRGDQGLLPGLPAWTASYVSLTDFDGVRRIFSRLGFGVALAGMIALCVRSGMAGQLGRWLFWLLAPASLTIGWVVNYMFETRRMVTFLVPLFVLASTTFLMIVSAAMSGLVKRWRPKWSALSRMVEFGLPCLLTMLLLLAALRGRTQLYTTWNNRRTYRFYHALAREIRAKGDFLLAEYTQTAAPLERLSGLPLLPIAWGYRSDAEYRQAEQVFERLVREHPDRRYLLISPFSGAAVPGLQSEPLLSATLKSVRLDRTRRSVPMQVAPRQLTLHLQRLRPPDATESSEPYTRIMDSGRLGLAGGANFLPNRAITLQGVPLGPGTDGKIRFSLPATAGVGRLYGMVALPEAAESNHQNVVFGPTPGASLVVGRLPVMRGEVLRFTLGPGWEGIGLTLDAGAEPAVALDIQASVSGYLTDLFWVNAADGQIQRLHAITPKTDFQIDKVDTLWFRASSAMTLPVGPSPRLLWMLATAGRETVDDVRASVRQRGDAVPVPNFPVEPGWRWHLFPLAPAEKARFAWHDLNITPAWDPGLHNFPEDLGLQVHMISVVVP